MTTVKALQEMQMLSDCRQESYALHFFVLARMQQSPRSVRGIVVASANTNFIRLYPTRT